MRCMACGFVTDYDTDEFIVVGRKVRIHLSQHRHDRNNEEVDDDAEVVACPRCGTMRLRCPAFIPEGK